MLESLSIVRTILKSPVKDPISMRKNPKRIINSKQLK